jgi:hypothetical protein
MADSYLQYCSEYKFKNEEEKKKFDKFYEIFSDLVQLFNDGFTSLSNFDDDSLESDVENFKIATAYFDKATVLNTKTFQESMSIGEVERSEEGIIFSDDGSGDIDLLGNFMQEFFIYADSDSYFSLAWSISCSRPRVGEFGGGAMIVTRHKQKFINDHVFLRDKEIKYDRRNALNKLEDTASSLSEEEQDLLLRFRSFKELRIAELLVKEAERRNHYLPILSELEKHKSKLKKELKEIEKILNPIYDKLL